MDYSDRKAFSVVVFFPLLFQVHLEFSDLTINIHFVASIKFICDLILKSYPNYKNYNINFETHIKKFSLTKGTLVTPLYPSHNQKIVQCCSIVKKKKL